MPPVPLLVPDYPFQHICSDYFKLHGHTFVVVVDRFSNWFNICVYDIYGGKGGAVVSVEKMTQVFQDFGVPETITSNGGPQFISDTFQTILKPYVVHHRLSCVCTLQH